MAGERDFQGMYYSTRNKAKSLAARVRELEDALGKKVQESDQRLDLLKRVNAAYKELEQQPRMSPEDFQYVQEVMSQQLWNEHVGVFKSALEDVLAPGVTAEQVLMAVGYDPSQVTELTPDFVQQLFDYASDHMPVFFKNGGFEEEEPEEPTDDQPEVLSSGDTFKAAFEAGAQLQQQQRQQTGFQNNGDGVSDRPSFNNDGRLSTQSPQPSQQTPSVEFKGFGQAASRGGPSPSKLTSVGAHLRDPAWIAKNQGALAQAVTEGVNVVSVDK